MDGWRESLATGLRAAADALDGGSSAVASPHPSDLALGLTALVRLVGPLQRIVEGRGDLADDAALANSVMDAVALALPSAAPAVETIELAEGALLWIAGAVRSGRIAPAIPAAFPPGGGPGAYRGR